MNEILSIESAGKLANYEKLKKEIESLKAFVKAEIQDCKIKSKESTYDLRYESSAGELKKVLEMLEEIDLK